MPWSTSTRRARLPKTAQWDRIRAHVKARAGGHCQAATHAPGCNGQGTDCDHITPGANHGLDNLQWLSHECHTAKTQAEARAAVPTRKRPAGRHPGLL
jgi:hypothetical protein